jgi:hypothetical protein
LLVNKLGIISNKGKLYCKGELPGTTE